MNNEVQPAALADYIAQYRRVHNRPPRLRDCVDHFDGRALNVLMSLWEAESSGLVKRADLRQPARKPNNR